MSSALWTIRDLVAATRGDLSGTPRDVTGVSIDTRTLQAGDLFVALQGDKSDGHDYVKAALEKGASAALVAKSKASALSSFGALVAVDDPLEALRQLGVAARLRSSARIAAVTGSVGKTGTKEALRIVLGRQAETHASAASYNNHFGVPLTLARMPQSAHYGVYEIGMNHAGEITPLVGMVKPHVALITTVEAVHLEFFDSVAGIADAKGEIFSGLEAGGTAVLNRDNAFFERNLGHAKQSRAGRIVSFGEHADADVRLIRASLQPDLSIVEASLFGAPVTYRIGSPGRHIVLNSLGVLAVAEALGADLALTALAFADVKPPSGRGARITLGTEGRALTLIDESYNANPASMRAALDLLGQAEIGFRGRRIAILGDMLELGPDAPALHEGLSKAVIDNRVDRLYACGPMMRGLFQSVSIEHRGAYAPESESLIADVVSDLRPGDVVMVKGSLGSRMAKIVDALKTRFGVMPQDNK